MMVAQNDFAQSLLAIAYGTIGGAIATITALRTRLAIMQRDINDNKRATENLAQQIDNRLSKMDRRQIISLQVIADVARKVGADGRFSDQLVRFLASDADAEDSSMLHVVVEQNEP